MQPAAHREDRVRLRAGRRVVGDSVAEPHQGPSDFLQVLAGGDRGDQRVDRRSYQPHPVLTGRVPVEDPVSSGLDDVERLARADDRDGGRVGSAGRQAVGGDVDDLDAVVPRRIGPGKVGVHPMQTRDQPPARSVGKHGQHVDIADGGVEVAGGQRAEQVQAHQGRSGHGHDRLADRNQHGVDGRLRRSRAPAVHGQMLRVPGRSAGWGEELQRDAIRIAEAHA
jgi:hypothetical protein